ncbi:MAG: hypothetical protein A2252_09670 [Elusimicrobia bacterium RIFOXYA2_FULL_39_19]|nr:MAG: hypothetical protein A2252_09670 [Elusimicrobia bacterium RIFOXYA2_FULL_39_19]
MKRLLRVASKPLVLAAILSISISVNVYASGEFIDVLQGLGSLIMLAVTLACALAAGLLAFYLIYWAIEELFKLLPGGKEKIWFMHVFEAIFGFIVMIILLSHRQKRGRRRW